MKKVVIITLLCGIATLAAMEQDLSQISSDEHSSREKKRKFTKEEDIHIMLQGESSNELFQRAVRSLDIAYTAIQKLHRRDKKTVPLFRHVTHAIFADGMAESTYKPSDIVKKRAAQAIFDIINKKSDDNDTIKQETVLFECLREFAKPYSAEIKTEIENIEFIESSEISKS